MNRYINFIVGTRFITSEGKYGKKYYLCTMKPTALRLFLLIQLAIFCGSFSVLKGQSSLCYRFIDTSYVKARIVHIWDPNCCCEGCLTVYCVVRNEEEKERAFAIFNFISKPADEYETLMDQDTDLLFLVSFLRARQFAIMKHYLDNSSLLKKYSQAQIDESLEWAVPVDSFDTYNDWKITDDDLSIGDLMYMGKRGDYALALIQPSSEILVDTVYVDNSFYCYKEIPFESWGVVLELQRGCDFAFYDETTEMELFRRNYKKLKLFIPLEERR